MTYWGKKVYFCTCAINELKEGTYWRLDGLYNDEPQEELYVSLTQLEDKPQDKGDRHDAIDGTGRLYWAKHTPSVLTLISQESFDKCFILVGGEFK